MAAVRQHYKLATTGKLGQNTSGKAVPKSGGKKSSMSSSMKKGSGYGSGSKKSGY